MGAYPNVLPKQARAEGSVEDRLRQLLAFHESSFQFALRCCRGDRSEAEDILQQAYAEALAGAAEGFRGEAQLKTWWYGLIRRLAGGFFRKLSRRAARLTQAEAPEPPRSPELHTEERERARRLAALIHRLPEKQRLPLHLYYYEEMTLEQIGEVLGVSSKTTLQSRIKAGERELHRLLVREGLR